jgi:hypothetical protein
MGKTGHKLRNIGQAFPDFVGLQLKGHGAAVIHPTQRFKQSLEVDHPFPRREMQVIGVGISSAVVVKMNVLDSFRELFDKTRTPVLFAKKLPMA